MNLRNLLALVLVLGFIVSNALSPAAFAQQQHRRPPVKKVEQPMRPANIQYTSMHHMAGCGLGSLAFKDEDKWSQVGASLLNFTGFQSFAISFGTSNCTFDGVVEARLERQAFVEANYADLGRDIAVGDGEYLSALATLYGCHGDSKALFKNAMHEKSAAVLADGADANSMLSVVDQVISGNESLSNSCGNS